MRESLTRGLWFSLRSFSKNRPSKPVVLTGKLRVPLMAEERIEPRIMDISSDPIFRKLFVPSMERLANLFKDNGYEIRIAGGAVRDILMGIEPADTDFASTATPTEMKDMFERESIRMLHKRGEEHGTITARIDDCNYEVTTLRVDVVCDGRRAEVEFTRDWQLDANRRDLTINSLFLDLDGKVHDYFGGVADVEKRRVAFVGDPVARIQEDYLRILRYFRFFGRIANAGSAHEESPLKAIRDNKAGLDNISGERIWTELKRIVIGKKADEVLAVMVDCGLAPHLGLPEEPDVQRFARLFKNHEGRLESATMIAALLNNEEDAGEFQHRCKTSNAERDLFDYILERREEAEEHRDDEGYWRRLRVDVEHKPGVLNRIPASSVDQLARSVGVSSETIEEWWKWPVPTFPIRGTDIMTSGVEKRLFGAVLTHLYELWKESDFTLNKEELLKHTNDPVTIPAKPDNKRKRKRTN